MAETGLHDGEVPTGRLPVILFPTCLGDLMSPQTVVDATRVLEACGCDVGGAKGTTCCGQPGFNSGFDAAARRVARPDGARPGGHHGAGRRCPPARAAR